MSTVPSDKPANCVVVPDESGRLTCRSCGADFDPTTIEVTRSERREGGSDPEYQSLRVQFTPSCPDGPGREQRLTLGYGPSASVADSLVLEQLQL